MQNILYILYKGLLRIKHQTTDFVNSFLFRLLLWINNCDYGKNIKSRDGRVWLIVRPGGKLFLGDNVTFYNHKGTGWNSRTYIRVDKDASLFIGKNSGANSAMISCHNSIKIGDYVNIGGGTRIFDSNFHDINWEKRRKSESEAPTTAPVVIEDDVFIGTGCIIGKGITIGARSIIAAGSVVIKDIPADCIAGGNPCKVIKTMV